MLPPRRKPFPMPSTRHEDPPPQHDVAMHERYPRNTSDVFHITSILRQLLLQDLIPGILDAAQYWPRVLGAETTEQKEITESTAGQLCLASSIPKGLSPHCIRKVIFTVTSRDQGNSGDMKWHGTYQHSWTWFNAIIFQPDAYLLANVILERERIITNLHAGKDYKTHMATWSSDSSDEQDLAALREAIEGRHVGITAWARFAGWRNSFASARIEFEMAVVTRG